MTLGSHSLIIAWIILYLYAQKNFTTLAYAHEFLLCIKHTQTSAYKGFPHILSAVHMRISAAFIQRNLAAEDKTQLFLLSLYMIKCI